LRRRVDSPTSAAPSADIDGFEKEEQEKRLKRGKEETRY